MADLSEGGRGPLLSGSPPGVVRGECLFSLLWSTPIQVVNQVLIRSSQVVSFSQVDGSGAVCGISFDSLSLYFDERSGVDITSRQNLVSSLSPECLPTK